MRNSLNCKSAREQALNAHSINTKFRYAEFTSEALADERSGRSIFEGISKKKAAGFTRNPAAWNLGGISLARSPMPR